MEILIEAGLPKGLYNVIQDDHSTGPLLVNHKDVAKVSLTGSPQPDHTKPPRQKCPGAFAVKGKTTAAARRQTALAQNAPDWL